MMTRIKRIATGVAFVAVAVAAPGWVYAQDLSADARGIVEQALGLNDFAVVQMELPAARGSSFITSFEHAGVDFTLVMEPHSIRSERFVVEVIDESGRSRIVEVAQPATYRGSVLNMDDSLVAGSLIDGQFSGFIALADGTMWSIQPLSDVIGGADLQSHLMYLSDDAFVGDFFCGTEEPVGFGPALQVPREQGSGDDEINMIAEIGIDSDVEFFNINGRSVQRTIDDIELVMGQVDAIYDRDVDIVYDITRIIVREAEPDPYSSTDPGTLLTQFVNEWNRNQGGVQRDVAHFFTGKNLNGGVIGIAFLRVICIRSQAYGLSQSRFTSTLSFRVALTAHELGHNWAALHCSGSDCRIMCPAIGGCSGDIRRFGQLSKNTIVNFRNSRSCLEEDIDFLIEVLPDPLKAGAPAFIAVTKADPNSDLAIFYSLIGDTGCFIAPANITLDLTNCVLALRGVTDNTGEINFTSRVPKSNTSFPIWIQGVAFEQKSNLVITTVFP